MSRTAQNQEPRRVGVFSTDQKTQEPLARLERNVAESARALSKDKAPVMRAQPARSTSVIAKLGEITLYDPSLGGVVINLPKVSQADHGQTLRIKNSTSSITAVTVRPAAGQTIDGSASASVSGALTAFHIYTDGSAWWFI